MGDKHFASLLLMGAYMNAAVADGLTMRLLLWSTASDIIRQMPMDEKATVSVVMSEERNHNSFAEDNPRSR